MIVIKAILALLLLLLGISVAFWMSRRWSQASSGRRPMQRHWITRLICGALGSAIVVAMTAFTIMDARRPYAEPATMDLRMPTLPPPELPARDGDLKKGRFLLHALIVSWHEGSMIPVRGETYDVRWPRDQGKVFSSTYRPGSTTVNYEMSLSSIQRYTNRGPRLDFSGSRTVHVRSSTFSSGSAGGTTFPDVHEIRDLGRKSNLFSVLGTSPDSGALLMDLTPVQEEDPLKPGSFGDFTKVRGYGLWSKEIEQSIGWTHDGESGSPAEALIRGLQWSLLALLAAAILLAQLFTSRLLGFVKIAACLLLYVGALDRLALRINESHLKDASAPVEQRLVACSQLTSTTFFRGTALRDLDATATDPSAPYPLRDWANQIVERKGKFHFP
jgi:hypothetical protein